jgi:two-component sensor histidine kinase
MPVGILILERQTKEILFYNKAITKLVRMHKGQPEDNSDNREQPVIEGEIMDVINNFKETNGPNTMGEIIKDWDDEILNSKYKYKYKKDRNKFVYTLKGLRLPFWTHDSKVFFLENQTPLEELRKLEAKYQKLYVASIVHDIRSPLNGVMGMIEKIDMMEEDQKVKESIDIARKACQLLLFLTYDITDYSQIEAHKLKPNLKKTDIREILKEITELLSFSFKTKGLGCNVVIRDTVPTYIMIDKHRYMQILLNLLTNALKFTFKGFIRIEVTYNTLGNQLITSVADTGIGIKTEDTPHLFKLFGKLESSSNINPQGVGFGLAMCKKLTEQLGGTINVQSKSGKGSTFIFSISANLDFHEIQPSLNVSVDEKNSHAELTQKIEGYVLKINKAIKNDTDHENPTSSSSKNLQGLGEAASSNALKGCGCNKVLIVDDDHFNLLVLQNYLRQFKIIADEVIQSYIH